MEREPLFTTLRNLEHSTTRTASSEGDWVVVISLQTAKSGVRGIPQLSGGQPVHDMQRYPTSELAIAGALEHSATSVAGGWAINLVTGRTVRIHKP